MSKLKGDIVVLIPGITGSVLERDGSEIWGLSAAAALRGILSGGKSIQDLRLEKDDPTLEDLGDGIRATRLVNDVHLLPGLWSIDGYSSVSRRLQQRLGLQPGVDFFELPYDWRRDNRVAARRLQRLAEGWLAHRRKTYAEAKLILVAHSMGGLISRYYIEVLGGWRDVRTLVTFGTPYRGSVQAVVSLVQGVPGLSFLGLAELCRSFTSVYQLLPIYPCVRQPDGPLRRLGEVENIPRLAPVEHDRIWAGLAFHEEIAAAVELNQAAVSSGTSRYSLRPVVGIDQPTAQSVELTREGVKVFRNRNGEDEGGDGTVPRVSATPIEAGEAQATFAVARHSSLQNADAVLAHLHGILTSPRDLGRVRGLDEPVTVSLDIEPVFARQDSIRFAVRPSTGHVQLLATLEGIEKSAAPPRRLTLEATEADWVTGELAPMPSGVYRLTIAGIPSQAQEVETVSEVLVVVG